MASSSPAATKNKADFEKVKKWRMLTFGKIGNFEEKYDGVSEDELKKAVEEVDNFLESNKNSPVKIALHSFPIKEPNKFNPLAFPNLTEKEANEINMALQSIASMVKITDYPRAVPKGTPVVVPSLTLKKVEADKVVGIDWSEFGVQVKVLGTGLEASGIREKLFKESAQLNPIGLMLDMLNNGGHFDAFGICTIRIFASKNVRDDISAKMLAVNLFKNRAGKLNRQFVNLLGYVGGACVNDDDQCKRLNMLTSNPLLGHTPTDRKLIRKQGETDDAYKLRQEKHKLQFEDYKNTMVSMQAYKSDYDAKFGVWKAQIKENVLKWLGRD